MHYFTILLALIFYQINLNNAETTINNRLVSRGDVVNWVENHVHIPKLLGKICNFEYKTGSKLFKGVFKIINKVTGGELEKISDKGEEVLLRITGISLKIYEDYDKIMTKIKHVFKWIPHRSKPKPTTEPPEKPPKLEISTEKSTAKPEISTKPSFVPIKINFTEVVTTATQKPIGYNVTKENGTGGTINSSSSTTESHLNNGENVKITSSISTTTVKTTTTAKTATTTTIKYPESSGFDEDDHNDECCNEHWNQPYPGPGPWIPITADGVQIPPPSD